MRDWKREKASDPYSGTPLFLVSCIVVSLYTEPYEGEATTPSSSRLLASSITQCILKTTRHLEKIGSMGCIRGQFPSLKYHLGSQPRPPFLRVTSFRKCRLVHCFPRPHTYLGIWPLNNLVFSEEQAQLTLHHMNKKQGTHHVVL